MSALTSALPLLVLHAVTVQPSSVPASGRHEAIVKLDAPAMVRVSTDAPSGMSCEIVDHLRGPFSSSGQPGKSACSMDLMLDEGIYKLRLRGPRKAKGNVAVKAVPFEELHKDPIRLVSGSEVRDELHPRQQASFWLKVDQRGPITFHAIGRTAGVMGVWRAGEWLETVSASHNMASLDEGQDLHEWWLEQVMEPGEYRITLYGTEEHRWTKGKGPDFLVTSLDFPRLDASMGRTATITVPESGFTALELPSGAMVATFAMDQSPDAEVTMQLFSVGTNRQTSLGSGSASGSCSIAAKALIPECAATVSDNAPHILVVRGKPGTQATMEWAPLATSTIVYSGSYATGARLEYQFYPGAGDGTYRISTHDVPPDADAPPLGCILERALDDGTSSSSTPPEFLKWSEVARDELHVSRASPFRRSFNHDGNMTRILFRVDEAAKYRITTGGERQTRCELWYGTGPERSRLTPSDLKAGPCDVQTRLEKGSYELTLHGGTEGIEKVRITVDGASDGPDTPNKSTCALTPMLLAGSARYRLTLTRSGSAAARGFFAEKSPVSLAQPYPVTIEQGAKVTVPLAGGVTAIARSSGGAPFSCERGGASVASKYGRCDLGALGANTEVSFSNPGKFPIAVLLLKPSQPITAQRAQPHTPQALELQRVVLEQPTYLDFDRGQQHALLFDVKDPGLYHVTTLGLLATTCDIRTPVVPGLGADSSGGRGRNCLVAQFLRPGRYLVNVRADGQSKGRAGLVVSKRPVKTIAPLSPDAQLFFRADAGELIRQTFDIKRPRNYQVDSSALGAALQCRLDDKDGWPLVRVPTSCSNTFYLRKDKYLWTQLPLTVESMRQTQLHRVKGAEVLKGNAVHKLDFNTLYAAHLGDDGKDEFTFELPVELDLRVLLTNAMQGRVYRMEGNVAKPAEVIPPMDIPPPPAATPENEEPPSDEGGDVGAPPSDDSGSSDEGAYPDEGAGEGDESGESAANAESNESPEYTPEPGEPEQPATPPAPTAPPGRVIHLPAGKYKLIAEHSRADVAIDYALEIFTDTLIPGATIEVSAPTKLPLRIPSAGTLRLHTEGSTDVRCRLFDANGTLLFENGNHGDDWNCAIAEPIAAGDYTVVLESETQQPGPTKVSASVLEVKDGGVLTHGATVALSGAVQSFSVPDASGDSVVHDFSLRSASPIGCALEAPDGKLLVRRSDTKECAFLARLPKGAYRVRLWTLANDAKVNVSHWERPIVALGGGKIPAGKAGTATVEHAGLYTTSGSVFCLPDGARGVLPRCGPEASLEKGAYVFSTFGPSGDAPVPLDERVAKPFANDSRRVAIGETPFIQRERGEASGLHLLDVSVPAGEPNAPACEIRGGARDLLDDRCVAASGPSNEAELRWSLRTREPIDATVRRAFMAYPSSSKPLKAGLQGLTWEGDAARYTLPGTSRAELVLPPETWAVLVDGKGAAVDVCGPAKELQRCVLGGGGGEVVIAGSAEHYVEANVTVLDAPERRVPLLTRYEAVAREEGRIRFSVPLGAVARNVEVEGALRCVTSLDDGGRVSGCRAVLPAGHSAEVIVDHGEGPLRTLVYPTGPGDGERNASLFSGLPQNATPIAEGRAEKLAGPSVVRSFEIGAEAAIHVRSDSGVCALMAGNMSMGSSWTYASDGFGKGCAIDRVLPPGKYLVRVRPFGDVPLSGNVSWTQSSVLPIDEGIADEAWIAPGLARFFRFTVKAPGKIGIGLRVGAETVDCTLYGREHAFVGDGCQQYLSLAPGDYLFRVRAPRATEPQRIRPVVFGLAGSQIGVPDEYLKDFFSRIGGEQ